MLFEFLIHLLLMLFDHFLLFMLHLDSIFTRFIYLIPQFLVILLQALIILNDELYFIDFSILCNSHLLILIQFSLMIHNLLLFFQYQFVHIAVFFNDQRLKLLTLLLVRLHLSCLIFDCSYQILVVLIQFSYSFAQREYLIFKICILFQFLIQTFDDAVQLFYFEILHAFCSLSIMIARRWL